MKKLLERLVKKMAKDYLPTYRYSDNIKKSYQDRFYGYKHTLGCGDGEIYDEQNMTSDHFPVMSPRERRQYIRKAGEQVKFIDTPQGINGEDGLMIVGDGRIYYNGYGFPIYNWNTRSYTINTEQQIVWLGKKYIMFPSKTVIDFNVAWDGIYIETECNVLKGQERDVLEASDPYFTDFNFVRGDIVEIIIGGGSNERIYYGYVVVVAGGGAIWFPKDTFPIEMSNIHAKVRKIAITSGLEAEAESITCSISNSAGQGQPENINRITTSSIDWEDYFKAGDAVFISGAATEANNKSAIIRFIDHESLYFDDNAFAAEESNVSLTIQRLVPAMDYVCAHDNRLWGCRGDTIYASKLGDPTNFNVFDGLASDSYAADVGSGGDFTACYSYNGYPLFFKEDHIYKVYGTRPQNYQIQDTMTLGVEAGSHKSLAVAGETLYYKSRAGFMAYTGGIPKNISADLGNDVFKYHSAVGGSNGVKYYVSVEFNEGQDLIYILFTFDPRYGIWHKEDDTEAFGWAYYNHNLYCLRSDGELIVMDMKNGQRASPGFPHSVAFEDSVDSFVYFGDFVNNDPNKKGISKIQFRCEVEMNSQMAWKISYDYGTFEDIIDSATRSANVRSTEARVAKRSFYRPLTPHRPDNYRLYIEGEGDWKLYSLSKDEYSGSELQKH